MEALRTSTGQDILSAFGVPPALFEARGDGSGQREAWRRFAYSVVQALAALIQAELRAKLHMAAEVGLDALHAADEDGRSRAMARRSASLQGAAGSGYRGRRGTPAGGVVVKAGNDSPGPLAEEILNNRIRTRVPEADLALAVIERAALDRDREFFKGPGLDCRLQLAGVCLTPDTIRRRIREGALSRVRRRSEIRRVFNGRNAAA